ncbi:MAG: NAD(P)H-hydrate epimerase [Chloroflexota bacterium]|nr:NAD(P)H-hydrate epimerase [Chloroflexota bacterium]
MSEARSARPRTPDPAAGDEPTAPSAPGHAFAADPDELLPAHDPFVASGGYDLDALAEHWSSTARRPPISAEAMRGADRRAQALGVSGQALMEQAGAAVAAAARALLAQTGRLERGPVLVLAGPGNNGGDGSVAARYLARAGLRVWVVLVATEPRPLTTEAASNWERLDDERGVERIHATNERDVRMLVQGIEKASLVIDALLGTGVRGVLRQPIRAAVELAARARAAGVPVLAVDAPTALDLTSGQPSDPVVRADATVTFHRPKDGLRTRTGRALAGRQLVAPIGIPRAADRL